MPSSSSRHRRRRGRRKRPVARDWAALPGDVLLDVFLRLRAGEVMRGPELVCAAWRRVAVEEPALWRRIDLYRIPPSSPAWRAAVDRSAGQCDAFEGECNGELLSYLVERAPSLKSIRLDDSKEGALDVALLKKLPLLEDVDISLSFFSDAASQVFFQSTCQACPHLKKLRLSFHVCHDSNYLDNYMDSYEKYEIPVMHKLHCLELLGYDLTAEGLTAIIDSCPLLETLNVTSGITIDMISEDLKAKCARVKNLRLPVDSDSEYNGEYHGGYGSEEGYGSDYPYDECIYLI